MNKKKVFVFSCYLPAKRYGGPLKSIYNLVETTSDEFDYYLISLDHDFQKTEKLEGIKPGWNKVGKANVLYVNEKDFNYKNVLKWMTECGAEVVYLCSVFYYKFNFLAVKVAKKMGIPVLLAPRSDLLPNCIHHKYAKKYIYLKVLQFVQIYRGIYYHSTSDEETESILQWMKTDINHVIQLPNIASFPLDIPRVEKEKDFLRMIYVGRVHPRKNLKYAVECIELVKGNVTLDVYGAMEDKLYWQECERIANQMGSGKTIRYCGVLSPLEVQSKYHEYDCLFFPTFNENYGHVIVESIIAGCPALISKGTTPWDDYNGNGGFCCDLNSKGDFVDKINMMIHMDGRDYNELVEKNREYASKHFDNTGLCNAYKEMFTNLIMLGNKK